MIVGRTGTFYPFKISRRWPIQFIMEVISRVKTHPGNYWTNLICPEWPISTRLFFFFQYHKTAGQSRLSPSAGDTDDIVESPNGTCSQHYERGTLHNGIDIRFGLWGHFHEYREHTKEFWFFFFLHYCYYPFKLTNKPPIGH